VTTIVVAGAGLAGVRTAERLRARGFEGRCVRRSPGCRIGLDRRPLLPPLPHLPLGRSSCTGRMPESSNARPRHPRA
jgi:nucleoside-diphosphate-sugar epimerase